MAGIAHGAYLFGACMADLSCGLRQERLIRHAWRFRGRMQQAIFTKYVQSTLAPTYVLICTDSEGKIIFGY